MEPLHSNRPVEPIRSFLPASTLRTSKPGRLLTLGNVSRKRLSLSINITGLKCLFSADLGRGEAETRIACQRRAGGSGKATRLKRRSAVRAGGAERNQSAQITQSSFFCRGLDLPFALLRGAGASVSRSASRLPFLVEGALVNGFSWPSRG